MRWSLFFFPWCLFADWAEETLLSLSLEEKVGQLFIAPACPRRGEDHFNDWLCLLSECHIGNVLVKQGTPSQQIALLSALQNKSLYPLLVAADFEWGLAMTMEETIAYPRNEVLGSLEDRSLIVSIGKEIGRQARLVGVHLNLAPVADVNNNPGNRVIGSRSFGKDPFQVADCVSFYLQGLHSSNVFGCVKHFPGHGDTDIDSHYELPLIRHSKERLQGIEWVPFRRAIEEKVPFVMTAHLLVPALDSQFPATLSKICLTDCLRKELGFQGLIVTDALNMGALTSSYSVEEIALLARGAGADLLLYGSHITPIVDDLLQDQIPRAFRSLLLAYQKGDLDLEALDETVRKILKAKELLGLHQSREIPEGILYPNNLKSQETCKVLSESSVISSEASERVVKKL